MAATQLIVLTRGRPVPRSKAYLATVPHLKTEAWPWHDSVRGIIAVVNFSVEVDHIGFLASKTVSLGPSTLGSGIRY